jgi:DNA-binding MurR/RpiR family transcriptional regulator
VSIVANFLERQSVEELEQIVDKLVQANTVFLTAVRSSYAVGYYLRYVGRMALPTLQLFPRHQNSALGDLNDAKEGNVLIAITVTRYSRETVEV